MVEMIHKDFGTRMWVHESRAEEYLAAGHKLAAGAPAKKPAVAKPKAKRTTAKK